MLKSVLALLLSKFVKRSDTEFIGHQAYAGPSSTSWVKIATLSGDIRNATYVAPADGYAHLSTGSFCTFAYLCADSDVSLTAGGIADGIVHWNHISIPVAKGQTLRYDYSSTSSQTAAGTLSFTKAIGS